MNMTTEKGLTAEQLEQFQREGYLVVRGFLSREEAEQWRDHFMGLHERGPVEGYFNPFPLEEANGDLLKVYPRMLLPHRWDETSKNYLLDSRLAPLLRDMLGEEPLAAQSMFYFKPPGARGQALHQDDFYLRTTPGHCLAAWLSLDDTNAENGGLSVVPGSHKLPVLCPHAADLRKSFTIEEVDVPESMEAIPVELQQGDILFFNGSVIHGSEPNVTTDRFRRSFICHYVPRSTETMSAWYENLLPFEGEAVKCRVYDEGGPCGTEEIQILREGVLAQGELARVGIEQNAIALP
jgi:phytanoyl-CoA hydroxylase